MLNRDGVISIGFDYRQELNKAVQEIEKELNSLGSGKGLSKGFEQQIAEIKNSLSGLTESVDKSMKSFSKGKIDTTAFNSFKKDINDRLLSVDQELENLKKQFGTLNGSADVSNIVTQFEHLKTFVTETNTVVQNLVSSLSGTKATINLVPNADSEINKLKTLKAELNTVLNSSTNEFREFGYSKQGVDALTTSLDNAVQKYYALEDRIAEVRQSLSTMNPSSNAYTIQEAELSKLLLQYHEYAQRISEIMGSQNINKIDWKSYFSESEMLQVEDQITNNLSDIQTQARNVLSSIDNVLGSANSNTANVSKTVDNTVSQVQSNVSAKPIKISIEVSTKAQTLWKQVEKIIDTVQKNANANPAVIPVKMTLTNKENITTNTVKEARKELNKLENTDIGGDLNKSYSKTLESYIKGATNIAKASIAEVKDQLKQTPLTINPKIQITEAEKKKITNLGKQSVVLSMDTDKLKDTLTTLNQIKETVDSINSNGSKKTSANLGFSRAELQSLITVFNELVNSVTIFKEALNTGLSDTSIANITKSITNMENTLARAAGITSETNIATQWKVVGQELDRITNKTGKFDGRIKNIDKAVQKVTSAFKTYQDMGGTNTLSSLTKNEEVVKKLTASYEALNTEIKEFSNKPTNKFNTTTSSSYESDISINKVPQSEDNFITANKEVKASVDNSESGLKQESQLMDSIAENADKAAKSKRDFAKANKEVRDSADSSNKANKKEKIEESVTVWNELNYAIQRYSEVSKRIADGKALDGDIEDAAKLEQKITTLQKSDILSEKQIKKSEQMLVKLYDRLDDLEKKSKSSIISSMQSDIDSFNKTYHNKNIKPTDENQSQKYKQSLADLQSSISILEKRKKELSQSDFITQDDIDGFNTLKGKVQENVDALNKLYASQKGSTELARTKEIDRISKYLEKNTRLSKEAKAKLEDYINTLKTNGADVNVQEIRDSFLKVANAEREAGREGKRFIDTIKDKAWYGWAQQIGTMFSFYDVINVGRKAINTIRELDTAFTEMRKVSDESVSSLEKFQDISFNLADNVGTTAKQIQNSTADWMRLGRPQQKLWTAPLYGNI